MRPKREIRHTRIFSDGEEALMTLEEWLSHRGLKKSHFAKLIGVSPVTVSRWISGEYRPQGYLVGNICHVLDCDWREIDWPERGENTTSSPRRSVQKGQYLTQLLRTVKEFAKEVI